MQNKYVGYLVISLGGIIGLITFLFNRALSNIVADSCGHGTSCSMWGTINFQTYISLIFMAIIILIGLYLVFFGKEIEIREKIIRKKVMVKENKSKKDYSEIMKDMDEEEKQVLQNVIDSDGTIFQSQIVEDTGFPKTKITRILDKLEGKGHVERRRRGMTNVVILKQ